MNRSRYPTPCPRGHAGVVLALIAAFALARSGGARAEDWPEMHVGVALGQANIRVDQQLGSIAADLLHDHSAWSVSLGTRPISWFGADLAYLDFGRPAETLGLAPTASSVRLRTRQQGLAGFVLGFLPLRTAAYDPYLKVGYIRLRSEVQASPSGEACVGTGCNGFSSRSLSTVLAWGGGVQVRLPADAFAVRLEYQQLEQRDANPHLVTAALLWRF